MNKHSNFISYVSHLWLVGSWLIVIDDYYVLKDITKTGINKADPDVIYSQKYFVEVKIEQDGKKVLWKPL